MFKIKNKTEIKNQKIFLNEKILYEEKNKTNFQDFAKNAYQNLQMNYPKFFKMDALSKLALLCTEPLLINQNNKNTAIILSNRYSSLDTDLLHQKNISTENDFFPSPATFVYTLPNICMGEIAIRHQMSTENTFFIADEFDPEFINNYASHIIKNNKAEKVLCGWIDFFNENYTASAYIIENLI